MFQRFQKNINLDSLSTFHIEGKAALYAEYSSIKELTAISRTPEFIDNEVLNIGEGSNLLFTENFDGLILRSAIKGMVEYHKNESTIYAIVGAGELWRDFVDWAISNNLAGIENLAGIPGTVGAAAVQNIGAYGMEAADTIYNVECFDTLTREVVTFTNAECRFAYRDSIFKNEYKGRYIVTRVSFRLQKSETASNLNYGSLSNLRDELGHEPSLREIADKVIEIRNSKLPDPKIYGNAGSFFKNPVVHRYFYEEFVKSFSSDVPCYPTPDPDFVKISAAWLIDRAGMKGKRSGDAEVWGPQPLVIINRGHADARDVIDLAKDIIDNVRKKFGIVLFPEVNYISSSLKVTVLGSGTSKGIPEVGCKCDVCTSPDIRDKRFRSSVMVESGSLRLLIDVSPDFRMQALREDIYHLDAALITHSHYDHVGGIDDLRPFCAFGKFPVYLRKDVSDDLHRRIDYCFKEQLYPGVPTFEIHEIKNEPFYISGLKITPISVFHGQLPIVGFRIADFAYITDAKTIPPEEMEKLHGLKVLILNALRYKPHFAHLSVDEALAIINEIKPEKAYLTHFNHEIGRHEEIQTRLPDNVYPCYDGQVLIVR